MGQNVLNQYCIFWKKFPDFEIFLGSEIPKKQKIPELRFFERDPELHLENFKPKLQEGLIRADLIRVGTSNLRSGVKGRILNLVLNLFLICDAQGTENDVFARVRDL